MFLVPFSGNPSESLGTWHTSMNGCKLQKNLDKCLSWTGQSLHSSRSLNFSIGVLLVVSHVFRKKCCMLLVVARWDSRKHLSQRETLFLEWSLISSRFRHRQNSIQRRNSILFAVSWHSGSRPLSKQREQTEKYSKVETEPRLSDREANVLPVQLWGSKIFSHRLMKSSESGSSRSRGPIWPIFEPDHGTNLF